MSGQDDSWKRHRRGRGRGGRGRHTGHHQASNSWGTPSGFKAPPPPRGLRGREIGMYYRNMSLRNGQNNKKKNCEITLKIPDFVINKLLSDLDSISKLAVKENIKIFPKKMSVLFDVKSNCNKVEIKTENRDVDYEVQEPSLKQLKRDSTPQGKHFAGSSSAPVIKEEPITEYESDTRVLALRGAGDYKYGYNDIITGSFNEKLDECLSKGINITKTNNEIASLNLVMYKEYENMTFKSQYIKMKKFRETLPAYKKSEVLLDLINKNQVVVISGETGCGKSTQVPQIILDDAILKKKGANVKILVTQPRRIAASSLAARVASERAEKMGESVGYAVRLEKVEARSRGSIMFCTTGILLVDMEVNQGLTDYSHVILDEVHERDYHIDFAMCMLKQVLQKRKDLKLILMSATLDAEKLSAYFNNCPMMHIEGLAYPVKDIYLEEILHLTGFQPKVKPEPKVPLKPWQKKRNKFGENTEKAIQYKEEIAPWLKSIKKSLDPSVYRILEDHTIEDLNYELIFELIRYICHGKPGAILVFLPGIGEITKLMRAISEKESELGRIQVHPLHSKLPSLDQNLIFQRPPEDTRKIIIATNIAETSITIDDIVYVIDCGKIKYNGLKVDDYLSTLKVEWVSQANLHQRRGRAGRCQPGVCYHLVTSYRASKLDERLLPEIQRSNLLEPVLLIKRLRLGKAAEALQNLPDPPAVVTVERAVTHLQQCGALDDSETLTPLGWHLARLPVHPAAGKLLVLGALFGCLDRAASVAAVWSFKDPFLLIIEKEPEIKAVKREFALGEPSDHVVLSEAIIQWERTPAYKRRQFAYEHFLSPSTLELLSDMKRQLADNLRQMGFLATADLRSTWENRNSDNLSLFKAIVAASLYPNIATARWINLNARNPNKQVRVKPYTLSGTVTIHPSSVMSPPKKEGKKQAPQVKLCSKTGANWLVYWLKQKSSDIFLIDITMVYTMPLLFFGELKVSECEEDEKSCFVSISEYKVKMIKEKAELILELRNLLDQVLASKIEDSKFVSTKHSQFEEKVLNAVIQVITTEDEGIEYPETDSEASECESRY